MVTDIEKSLEFYKEVVGFTEGDGFDVTGDFPKKVGLTDGTPLKIHVLTLGEDETATKLKLMEVSSSKPTRKIKQPYIHTLSGFSYLTIFVKDDENRCTIVHLGPSVRSFPSVRPVRPSVRAGRGQPNLYT